ncbi:GGDEF domain-containing protein [Cohnella nanjingensis]|uniref:GGDEF domain-containing protein n=1 Tax=Cohnella nanjingensis TaxID=1387779 RepID=A0A7X0RPD3_9BACL|nr:GGDEF domain-containing protein [Cohnella nanjingensis]MBB6671008.1 GGDEF domain-containing protein [Cohnella nanjingensis]
MENDKRGRQLPRMKEAAADAEASPDLLWTNIEVRYAPIVSLLDGSAYGYEAVPFRKDTGRRWTAEAFFAAAEAEGTLYACDRRFREAAIRGLPVRRGGAKLFLPVPACIVNDARIYPGTTLRRIEAAGLRPEHVVLQFLCRSSEEWQTLQAALRHYRLQGFRIALSGIVPERESLRRMSLLQPDYAQVEGGWIAADAAESPSAPERGTAAAALASRAVDESLLGAITTLARKEQIVLIVNGIAGEAQIAPLVAAGVGYGQGDWIGAESAEPGVIRASAAEQIRQEVSRRYRGAAGTLSDLTLSVATFRYDTPVSEIARHFEWQREAHGFIIAEEGRPIGLLMKDKLHQLLSGQFGLPLYWNRPVGKIMDTQPMIVDESMPIDQVSQMSMSREPDKLYDAVIVTREGKVAGIASIRALLEWVTHARMTDAQWANPLTGLPGNEPIRRELMRRVAEGRPFAVLYADLDHFKWFNDRFGFHRGDDVIRYTGEAIASYIRTVVPEESFVGHIGGDDFIAVLTTADPVGLSRGVLERFESGVGAYSDPDAGPVLDREGRAVDSDGISLSLALLVCERTEGWTPEKLSERAALLKKEAKRQKGHSLAWETVESERRAAAGQGDLTLR